MKRNHFIFEFFFSTAESPSEKVDFRINISLKVFILDYVFLVIIIVINYIFIIFKYNCFLPINFENHWCYTEMQRIWPNK